MCREYSHLIIENIKKGDTMTLTIVLVVSALIAVIDQLIKYFVLQYLAPVGSGSK